MPRLIDIIKPNLRKKLQTKSIPDFLPSRTDSNVSHQASIWSNKAYQVDPKTHVFTTIQEHYGNRLIKSINLPKDAVVVDIGCFIGEKLWQTQSNKPYLGVGVDIAIDALNAAKQIDCFDHVYIAANMEDLPFRNNSVDLVMVFDVIEHLTNMDKGISEVSRVLKPGGKLLLHTPVRDNKWSLFWWKQQLFPKEALKDYMDVGHTKERMPTQQKVELLMSKYGLKIIKKTHYNAFIVHFFDRELFKILAFIASKTGLINNNKPEIHSIEHKKSRLRDLYGEYIVPLLEIISLPDKLLTKLGVGNTCFYLMTKENYNHTKYYQKNNSYSKFLNQGKVDSFDLYIKEILKTTPQNGKFLDIGCGTGIVVNELCKRGIRGYGVEVSETSLKVAKTKKGTYTYYDGTKLPYKSGIFDCVGSYTVVEHVQDVLCFLNESLRVLKSKGYIIVCAPNFLTITSSYHYRMSGLLNKARNIGLTFKKLVQLLFKVPVQFESFPPIVREPFQADDDAVNLINPIDILRWGKQNNLTVVQHSGAIASNYLSYKLRNIPLVNLFTGGVLIIFRKP